MQAPTIWVITSCAPDVGHPETRRWAQLGRSSCVVPTADFVAGLFRATLSGLLPTRSVLDVRGNFAAALSNVSSWWLVCGGRVAAYYLVGCTLFSRPDCTHASIRCPLPTARVTSRNTYLVVINVLFPCALHRYSHGIGEGDLLPRMGGAFEVDFLPLRRMSVGV